jgi:cytochrome c biogenesis protein CcmG, thiol:disulfide interchange protein DsbE
MTRSIALAAAAALMLLALPSFAQEAKEETLVGKQAPDLTLPDLKGEAVTLSELKGHPVILDFWASWCGPCQHAMPELQKLYDAHKEDGLKVLGASVDEKQEDAAAFVKEANLTFTILWMDQATDTFERVVNDYSITGIPRTIFIDKDGVVQEDLTGLHTAEQYQAALAKIGIE